MWTARTVCWNLVTSPLSDFLEVLSPCHFLKGCLSLNREDADDSDEDEQGQTADGMDVAAAERAESSPKNDDQEENAEKLTDDELAEYDLDKYDEEEDTGRRNFCIRYAL